jgi:molybdate-binding protein
MPKISDMLRAGKGLAENSPRNRKRSSNKRPSFDKKLLASTHKAFAAAGYSMVSRKSTIHSSHAVKVLWDL